MAKPATTSQAPAPKRRRADADRSVAAILDAGLEALASDPDSSMSEIARRAGVVRATVYVHFPTRTDLLDAVMEYAVGMVVEAMKSAEPQRGEPVEALVESSERRGDSSLSSTACSRSTWPGCRRRSFIGVTVPMLDQLEPLIERGQKKGVFRRDLPVVWHLAVLRAIVHAASTEIRGGRISESEAEPAMLSTAISAISE